MGDCPKKGAPGLVRGHLVVAASAFALVCGASAAHSQDRTLTEAELVQLLEALGGDTSGERPKVASIQGIGSGYTSDGGTIGLSFSASSSGRPGAGAGDRGALGAGLSFGFGDATNAIAVEVSANFTSVHAGFLDSGYLEARASRRFSTERVAGSFMVGATNLAPWGDASGNSVQYLTAVSAQTQVNPFGTDYFPVMGTLGYGTGVRNAGTSGGVFGGIGVGLTPYVSASAAWSGDEAAVGLGITTDVEGLSINLTVNDVTDRNDVRRATVSVSYSFSNVFGWGS
jgi:hypothetical protein